MRATTAALVGAALLAAAVGCAKRVTTGPAWMRWGITKPTAESDAEAKLADAHRLLYELKVDSARIAYQHLVDSFPKSADAHLGLSMACRYSSRWDAALSEAREAYKLDPNAAGVLLNYADLILPIRTGPLPDLRMSDSARYAESEKCMLKATRSRHPFNAHAHVSLWASYMAQGRLADARKQAFELSQTHYYLQPLLDFAYNLLVGLEPNAILFTNGDNDTYPPWVLQQASEPFRPDVTVANLNLLNIPAVVKIMKDSLGLPVSFADEEIPVLHPKSVEGSDSMELVSEQVVGNVIANASDAKRPVYFAVTVSKNMTAPYVDRLVLEGLVQRVTDSEPAAPVDLDRIQENLTKNYRLDWPETLPPWPQNMSPLTRLVAPLALSYATIYERLATRYDELGRKAEADAVYPEVAKWALRAGEESAARAFVDEWLKRLPDDAKAQELKDKLKKTETLD
jgi:hypothetical protein